MTSLVSHQILYAFLSKEILTPITYIESALRKDLLIVIMNCRNYCCDQHLFQCFYGYLPVVFKTWPMNLFLRLLFENCIEKWSKILNMLQTFFTQCKSHPQHARYPSLLNMTDDCKLQYMITYKEV